ncbi:MAG: UvrB/UvrC motif-containing protein [Heliobacteriaceae bacterium]|nr:UvrB/UvrC motif-containing protein [Heliobacteriaceae bacterium]MDD4588355.1 UvrB/UvrC motif-containing protein [Heliobacteriaceae bacterium]
MFCEECKKRPATVHLTKIVNGVKSEVNLCEECAHSHHKELGLAFEVNFPINKFLAGLLGYNPNKEEKAVNLNFAAVEKCSNCGMAFNHIGQIGRLGCDNCYLQFQNKILPLLRRVQGSNRHTGKVPHRTGGAIRVQREIQSLRAALQQHVAKEEFEQAAKIRDRIRDLEKGAGE